MPHAIGFQSEIFFGNDVLRHEHGAADGRPKLPAHCRANRRPTSLDRQRGKPLDGFGKLDIGNIEEPLRQVRYVLPAPAQRRDEDGVFVQPEVKVGTERTAIAKALRDPGRWRSTCGRPPGWAWRRPPDTGFLLEHAEQLGLRSQRHVGNLIQEERSPVGRLDLSNRLAVRSGERPSLMSDNSLSNSGSGMARNPRGMKGCRARPLA